MRPPWRGSPASPARTPAAKAKRKEAQSRPIDQTHDQHWPVSEKVSVRGPVSHHDAVRGEDMDSGGTATGRRGGVEESTAADRGRGEGKVRRRQVADERHGCGWTATARVVADLRR